MFKKLLPHLCLILSLMMLTFFVVDIFNPGMDFVGNDIFKILLLIYGIATAVLSSVLIVYYHRKS